MTVRRTSQVLPQWLGAVDELLRQPSGGFPYEPLLHLLVETFESRACFTWVTPDGRMQFRFVDAPDDYTPESYVSEWLSGALPRHPLLRWFRVTRDSAAMTLGRVPTVISPPGLRAELEDVLQPFGIEQQLSMPCRLDARGHRAFVLARAGEDFSDEDLEIARSLQPLLMLLDRHVESLAGLDASSATHGLSGREVAVLRLLAEGGTACSIGTQLGISPRTVQKHLERTYRKLGVTDRVRAVREGERLGLVPLFAAGSRAQAPSAVPDPSQ